MKDCKNKEAFTCLVKHFRSNPLMATLRSRNARRSQTKFRSIAAYSYGFTLAETLIVLIVLGVVGMITIPNVIRRYQESQARTKIKKTMAIYDYTIQKVALENDLKSESALKQWANNDGQCTNSRKLFDIAEGEGCTFMTKDKIYLNISDITHIVVSLKKFEPAGVKLAKRKADDNMDETTFYFVTTYDPKTGSFRTNDLGYEKNLDENSDDTQRVENLIAFLTGKEPEVDVCKTGTVKYLNNNGSAIDTIEETYSSKGKVTSRKTTYSDGSYREEFFDSNGNPTLRKHYDQSGNSTGETKYEYDSDGNQTAERNYDGDGNLTGEYRYEYDMNGNQTSYKKYDGRGNLKDEYRYEYDMNGNQTSYKKYDGRGNLYYEYRYEYDGNGNQTSMKNYDSNGNLTSEERYEYSGNGNQTSYKSYDGNGNLIYENRYEYDGNGNMTSFKYYYGNGNLAEDNRYEYDRNGNRTSEKYYDYSGNLDEEFRFEYDKNGNQTSSKYYGRYGNLENEYTQSYEYDSCGRIIKYSDSDGANYSL